MGRPKKDYSDSICSNQCGAVGVPLSKGKCRKCYQKEYDKLKYAADPQAAIAKVKEWNLQNPDQVRLNKRKTYARYKNDPDFRARQAKWSRENPELVRETRRVWRENNRTKLRARQAKYQYGLAPERYIEMTNLQAGKCAICTEEMNPPHVDHNHVTGVVRELLCIACNTTLGYVEVKGFSNLEKMRSYLEKHNEQKLT